MKNYKHIMLDLETMSTQPNAAIVAIGAVVMDFETGELGPTFYEKVHLESSMEAGGDVSGSTVDWWLQQSPEAQAELSLNRIGLQEALSKFYTWLSLIGEQVKVWGNGAGFDNVVLRQAYESIGKKTPWYFRDDMCYRTLKAMHPEIKEDERQGVFHNALHDAEHQGRHLIEIMKNRRL